MAAELKYIKGDLFQNLPKDRKVMIPHVCNDIGAWGAGFVIAIDTYSEKPKQDYHNFLASMKKCGNADPLGSINNSWIEDGNIVSNMIAQRGVDGKHPLRYFALMECMRKVRANMNGKHSPDEIYCPKFGSGLAGGNWCAIERMIIECWVDNDINVKVFEL